MDFIACGGGAGIGCFFSAATDFTGRAGLADGFATTAEGLPFVLTGTALTGAFAAGFEAGICFLGASFLEAGAAFFAMAALTGTAFLGAGLGAGLDGFLTGEAAFFTGLAGTLEPALTGAFLGVTFFATALGAGLAAFEALPPFFPAGFGVCFFVAI